MHFLMLFCIANQSQFKLLIIVLSTYVRDDSGISAINTYDTKKQYEVIRFEYWLWKVRYNKKYV
jgi:hypothetical protein